MSDIKHKMDEEERTKLKELRKRRLSFQLSRFKKTWRIYYKNGYGKVGFYILLAFVVLTLLSPVLTFHKDSSSYIAPTIDTTIPLLLSSNYVGNGSGNSHFEIASYGSSTSTAGSNYVYSINSNGQLVALRLLTNNSTSTTGQVYTVANMSIGNSVPIAMSMFTLVQSVNIVNYEEQYANYIMVATSSGDINLSRITDVSANRAVVAPHVVIYENIVLANSTFVLAPISSVLPNDQSQFPAIPFYSLSSGLYGANSNIGRIFAVTRSTVNSSYYLTELIDNGLTISWQKRLPLTTEPTGLQMYGSFFTYSNSQLVVLTAGSTVMAYHMNGALAWETNITGMSFTGNTFVPRDYQNSPKSSNFVMAIASNSQSSALYAVNASNGNVTSIFNATSPDMTAVSSSVGSQGFPSSIGVIVGNDIYILSGPNQVQAKLSLATDVGSYRTNPVYNPVSDTFIITSSEGGMYSLSRSLGTNPFTWGLEPKSTTTTISSPNLILNSATGLEAITFRSSDGYIYVYSANGKSINPIPPTIHTASGDVFLFGTNSIGNDVWSQFIASFPVDWEVGIAVGLVGIGISIVFGIMIGYYRGYISAIVDTITLTIFLIPFLPLLIALTSVVKPSLINVIWILSITGWPFITFTILGIIRSIKQRSFVDAAKVSGAKTLQIIRRHMMPNILPLLTYLTAGSVSGAVGAIATLQFLGLVPLTIQTWGAMLNPIESNFYIAATALWWVLPPTIALTLFVMAFIFVSRGIDEVVNPRLRRR